MELYTKTSEKISKTLMHSYSTSFGWSTLLFPLSIRQHIYNIYGLVRIADEVVDCYNGKDQLEKLKSLEKETLDSIKTGYSSNPVVHSFAQTYRKFNIDKSFIKAFFQSMEMDTKSINYTDKLYRQYIYGSAEVIGLMCLAVFCDNDKKLFDNLRPGAQALGAAYQKINFLRDLGSDSRNLKRMYFPGVNINNISDADKDKIIKDINKDLILADKAIAKLPQSSYKATYLSRLYYSKLLEKISNKSIDQIINTRYRINNFIKIWLLLKALSGIK